jgi:hypothetical protein
MIVRLSALCTGCSLLPGRFLVLISVRHQGHSSAGRIRLIENAMNYLELADLQSFHMFQMLYTRLLAKQLTYLGIGVKCNSLAWECVLLKKKTINSKVKKGFK